MKTKLANFFASFLQLDIFTHLSIMVGAVAITVLIASFFTFFLYLYQPIFSPFETVFVVNPSIDYELLNKASNEVTKRQRDIATKLSLHYSDPFQ